MDGNLRIFWWSLKKLGDGIILYVHPGKLTAKQPEISEIFTLFEKENHLNQIIHFCGWKC